MFNNTQVSFFNCIYMRTLKKTPNFGKIYEYV